MSEYILLDTNVVSYIFKKSKDSEQYLPLLKDRFSAISFITV